MARVFPGSEGCRPPVWASGPCRSNLDGPDQVENARRGVQHGLRDSFRPQRRGELRQHHRNGAWVEVTGERFQPFGHHTKLGQLGRDMPGLLDLMPVQPADNLIFANRSAPIRPARPFFWLRSAPDPPRL